MPKKITFRITIISMYALLASILVVVTFSMIIYFDKMMIEDDIQRRFTMLCDGVEDTINKMEGNVKNILNTSSIFRDVIKTHNNSDIYRLNKIFTTIIKNNTKFYSMYIGYGDGCFHEIISLDANESLRQTYNAKDTDRWLLVEVKPEGEEFVKILTLLDKDLHETSKVSMPSDYDPRSRPWYKLALQSEGVVKTDPYTYSNIDSVGVTYALKLNPTSSVLCVDVLLTDLGKLLSPYKSTPSTKAYIWGRNGELLASTNNASSEDILFAELIETAKGTADTESHYSKRIKDEKYLLHLKKTTQLYDGGSFLGVAAPYEEVIAAYTERSYKIFIACVVSFFLMIPLLLYLVSMVSRPIAALRLESDKVGKREFDQMKRISSHVIEIDELSKSMFTMSQSIQSYEHNLEQKIEERTKELAEKNKLLHHLSITDKLTGLRNRVHLDYVLETEMRRSQRSGRPFGVIIVDIDHFKSVNDTCGHQVGDCVLQEFAKLISNSIRETDTAGRWGGEEFLIICPDTGPEGIAKLAKKICCEIAGHTFATVGNKTASFGTATFQEGDKVKDLIARADQALYHAKENGRNQVCEA